MPEIVRRVRGKRGLVMGMADNRSIAWGIDKAARAQGAALALTYFVDGCRIVALRRPDLAAALQD